MFMLPSKLPLSCPLFYTVILDKMFDGGFLENEPQTPFPGNTEVNSQSNRSVYLSGDGFGGVHVSLWVKVNPCQYTDNQLLYMCLYPTRLEVFRSRHTKRR